MPGSYGFTGQHADSTTGLDYDNARYYDPAAGAFTSADMLLQEGGYNPAGLNRYAYVLDNPETYIDPTGYDGYPWWYYILMGWATLIGAFNNKFGDIHATPDPPPPPIVIRIPPKGPGAGSGRGSDDKRNNRGGKRRPPKGPSGLPNPNKNPITVPGIKGHKIVPTFPRKKQDSQKQDSSKKQADLRRFGEPNANGWDGWAKPVDLRRFGEPNYSSWDGWQSQNQDQNQDQDQNQNQNQNQGGCDLQCQLEWFLVGIAAVGSAILSGSGGGGGLPPIPIPTEGGVPCADPAVRLACD
jgi:RHS repeat-associated protein